MARIRSSVSGVLLNDPAIVQQDSGSFDSFMEMLSHRSLETWKAVHVLVLPGLVYCLDCKIGAGNADTLFAEIRAQVAGGILPEASHSDLWRTFWDAPFLGMHALGRPGTGLRMFAILRGNIEDARNI